MDSIPVIPEEMSHDQLLQLRKGKSPAEQAKLAPLEHRAFAREYTRDRPVVGPASLAVAIPAYTLAKALGLIKSRSPASFAEMGAGFRGIYEGLTVK